MIPLGEAAAALDLPTLGGVGTESAGLGPEPPRYTDQEATTDRDDYLDHLLGSAWTPADERD